MYYVYVLKSLKDLKGYIGSTTDLKIRLGKHARGEVLSTRPRRPLILVYYKAYRSLADARKREFQLKRKGQAYAQLRKRIKESLGR